MSFIIFPFFFSIFGNSAFTKISIFVLSFSENTQNVLEKVERCGSRRWPKSSPQSQIIRNLVCSGQWGIEDIFSWYFCFENMTLRFSKESVGYSGGELKLLNLVKSPRSSNADFGELEGSPRFPGLQTQYPRRMLSNNFQNLPWKSEKHTFSCNDTARFPEGSPVPGSKC